MSEHLEQRRRHRDSEPSEGLSEFWSWLDGDTPANCAPETSWAPNRQQNFGYAITGSGRRRRPRKAIRDAVLDQQNGTCLYCEYPFGAIVMRRNRPVMLRLNWDHFKPYSFGLTNESTNWVAACHVCNGIKSFRVFDTVRDAAEFILNRWAEKGYVYHRPGARVPDRRAS